jgi:hypothetical protein
MVSWNCSSLMDSFWYHVVLHHTFAILMKIDIAAAFHSPSVSSLGSMVSALATVLSFGNTVYMPGRNQIKQTTGGP